jgi:hypothetical protein
MSSKPKKFIRIKEDKFESVLSVLQTKEDVKNHEELNNAIKHFDFETYDSIRRTYGSEK